MINTFDDTNLELDAVDIYIYTDNSDQDLTPHFLGTNTVLGALGGTSTFTADDTTDELTLATDIFDIGHLGIPLYDSLIKFQTTGILPDPLLPDTEYLAEVPGPGQPTKVHELNGDPIDITDAGTGIHTVILAGVKYAAEDLTNSLIATKDSLVKLGGIIPVGVDYGQLFYLGSSDYFIQFWNPFDYSNIYFKSKAGVDFYPIKVKNVIGFESVPPVPFRSGDKVRFTNPGLFNLPDSLTDGADFYLLMLDADKFYFLDAPNGNVIQIEENVDYHVSDYPLLHIEELETRAIRIPGHGFTNGMVVLATTAGTLPTPLQEGVPYYVMVIDADTFYLSTTFGDWSPVYLVAGTGSGTHTLTSTPASRPLDEALLEKYRAYPGVPQDLSFDETKREYFRFRLEDLRAMPVSKDQSVDDYMDQFFRESGYEEGAIDYRERIMFIDEGSGTNDMTWEAAAFQWANS